MKPVIFGDLRCVFLSQKSVKKISVLEQAELTCSRTVFISSYSFTSGRPATDVRTESVPARSEAETTDLRSAREITSGSVTAENA